MAQVDLLCALQELEAMRTAIENQKVRHLQNELEMLHVMQVGRSVPHLYDRTTKAAPCSEGKAAHARIAACCHVGFAGKGALC